MEKNTSTISGETNQTLEVTKAGTYQVIVSASGCTSVNDQVTVTSSLVEVSDETVCTGQTGTFTVNNPGSFDYKWYVALNGGGALATSDSYTTPILSSSTSYYVEKDDPTGGVCNGVANYNATTTYNAAIGTIQVVYNGKLYENTAWWALGYEPGVHAYWTEVGTCGSACLRTKVTAIIDNGCSSNPAVSVTAGQNNVCETTNITFTATATDAGVSPVLIWKVNGTQKQSSTSTTYSSSTLDNNDVVQVSLASDGTVKDEVTMILTAVVTPSVAISEDANNVCSGTNVTFTATPTNGGTPTYKWFVGTTQQSETSSSFTYTPSNGDAVKVEMTTSLTCVTGAMATSNVVSMIVDPSTTPTVVISEDVNNVCSGTNVTFSATPSNAGTTPTYDWVLNSGSTGITTSTYSSTAFANGDKVKLILTSSEACPTGTATSSEVTMTVNSSVTPTATIVADKNPICPGENVIFSATLANEGSSPVYDWILNSSSTGISTSTYSNSGLNDGDKVKLTITSSEACTSSSTATSNEVTISVGAAVTPSVAISEDANNVCSGTNVTFTATPTNGGTPTYKWFVGTTQQSETSNSFTYAPSNGDAVKVEMTTSLTCVTGAMASSNVVNMIVNPSTTPTVVISEDVNNVCSGTNVTFSATPSNAGTTPTYDWVLNSGSTGITTSTYSSTAFANGDKVKLILTSSEACPTGTATSNEVTMIVKTAVSNSSSIPSQNLTEGFSSYQIDLSSAFTGTGLSYSASTATVVGLSISGSMATVSNVTSGLESITVTAQDVCGETAQTQIQFVVTALGVINPTLTVSQPSGTSIILTEGELLNVNFDAIAGQGVLTTVSAEVKNAGSLVSSVSLNNTGGTYSGSWTSIPGTYDLLITVANDQGGLTTKTISVTVNPITLFQPTVTLTVNPNLGLTEGDLSTISWVASDADGTIDVEVIKLDNVIQSWTSGSSWTATAGQHTILITVTDNDGATATDQVRFNVASIGDNEALIAFVSPTTGETLGDDPYLVQVTATDIDGLSNVQLKVINPGATFPFNQAVFIDLTDGGSGNYSGDWIPAINGNYILTIITTDNNGETTESTPITVTVDDQFTVGFDDDLDPSRLSMIVYPNPALGDVTVDYNVDGNGEGALILLDISGNLIDIVSEGNFSSGIQSVNLSTSDLPVGIYILKLNLNGEVIIKKFVKE